MPVVFMFPEGFGIQVSAGQGIGVQVRSSLVRPLIFSRVARLACCLQFINMQLMADRIACEGYLVVSSCKLDLSTSPDTHPTIHTTRAHGRALCLLQQ